MSLLLDRVDERRALDRVLADAARGSGGACVVIGDPGMGKTRLLEYAVDSVPDVQSVWITGIAAETTLGFAGLHRLLSPFLSQSDVLPDHQRRALESALGLSDEAPADVFLVGLACLTLLTHASTHDGLLCVVDDAQWLDAESLAVLAFVGRRLSADRVALLFGVRRGDEPFDVLDGLATVPVEGLARSDAMELLVTQVDVELSAELAERIVDATSGCPLALLELSSDLTEDQLRGGRIVSEPLPISKQLENHFLRQVARLDPPAQQFMLIAAAETSGEPDIVRRAMSHLRGEPDHAAERQAVSSDLLSVGWSIVFRHPLIRSAVYSGADEHERLAVHAALAAVIDPETDPDRRAQHVAAAARGPDEDVADELEQAAQRAGRRGGYSAEASFLLHAAQLSPSPDERARRLLGAAFAAFHAGQPHRALTLLDQARPDLSDPLTRAEAMRLDGRLRVPLAQPAAGAALLLEAAKGFEPIDPARVRSVLLEALDVCFNSQHFTAGTSLPEVADAALATSRAHPAEPTLHDLLLEGIAHLFLKRYDVAMPMLRAAAEQLLHQTTESEDVVSLFILGLTVTEELWDDEAHTAWAGMVEERARRDGALYALRVALLALGKSEIRRGNLAAARVHFEETVDLARAVGIPAEYNSLHDVELLAWQGSAAATEKASRMIEAATAIGVGSTICKAAQAMGTLALGEGRHADALDAVRPMVDIRMPGFSGELLIIAIEAAVRTDDSELADRCTTQLEERALAAGSPWVLGLLARARALTADPVDAEAYYLESIALLDGTTLRTELAQSHLLYGEFLRRQLRRSDARAELKIALEMFSTMGAEAFVGRTTRELAATGERVRRRSVETANELTPQESQIARLAADGLTNAQIGARLFISANTVDYHLRKVFRKVGVTSRVQLARRMDSADGPTDPLR